MTSAPSLHTPVGPLLAEARTRKRAELIADVPDARTLITHASPDELVDAVVLLTHRLHDVVEDHGDRSRQADDMRARRRRVKAELVRRASRVGA